MADTIHDLRDEQVEAALTKAVSEALDRNQKMGIPSVFKKDGRICYRMPDGKQIFEDELPR